MTAVCRRSLLRMLCTAVVWLFCLPLAGAQMNPGAWSERWLLGSVLRLVDETQVEELRFGPEGVVTISSGKRGGPLTGPLMNWRVHQGKLEIGHPDSYDTLELVSFTGSQVVVKRRSGAKVVFEIQRQ
jgi:hypothetical protein